MIIKALLVRAVLVRVNAAALVEVIGRATLDELTGPRLADLSLLSRFALGSEEGCCATRKIPEPRLADLSVLSWFGFGLCGVVMSTKQPCSLSCGGLSSCHVLRLLCRSAGMALRKLPEVA